MDYVEKLENYINAHDIHCDMSIKKEYLASWICIIVLKCTMPEKCIIRFTGCGDKSIEAYNEAAQAALKYITHREKIIKS